MPTKRLKDETKQHFQDVIGDHPQLGVYRVLRNLEAPDPPRRSIDIEGKFQFYLSFPVTKQSAEALGDDVPWQETGSFMIHILTEIGTGEDLLDEIQEIALNSVRGKSIGNVIDCQCLAEADPGPRFGGNFWGVSIGVEFDHRDIPQGLG